MKWEKSVANRKKLQILRLIKIESTLTDDYKFRKSGNEEQFKHNLQVLSKLKEVETQLKPESIGENNITAAKEKIAEGIHLVCHRQKLAKLADSSQLGWKVIQEYESNTLAED